MYILKGEHKKGLSASKLRSRQNLLAFAIDTYTFTISKLLYTLYLTNLSKSMYQIYIKTHTKKPHKKMNWLDKV